MFKLVEQVECKLQNFNF